MSKIRGVLPLFLATSVGIVNGIWVFQPLLAAKQEEKDNLAKQLLDVEHQAKEGDAKVIREAENAASRISATEAALKPIQPSSSWWPNISLWSKSENAAIKDSTDLHPRIEATKISKDSKEANT
ncbi:uncharacterized protein K444DRAFT_613289 [Hyaloscypha bicolor E]|uniref:Uncharacterized protein n=1 Tax=Hyaloscypha bicolor E TaxID=1095630 RepID=A0A2J6T9P3_9HELO|nr:uncharacterized protein K444DRAFT_613289 [Hyaloscypha bicolor E]PMD59740.1 hypothetical protein K444DRAFT_613289 [Hyaloscypha bicolor E]